MLRVRDFGMPGHRNMACIPQRHEAMRPAGAAASQCVYLAPTYQWERIGIVGMNASGVLAAAGRAVLEARKAPVQLSLGYESYEAEGGSPDSSLFAAGYNFDTIAGVNMTAAGALNGAQMLPPNALIVTRPQSAALSVPLLRFRDADMVFASGTFTFGAVPPDGATITIFGVVCTWKTTLTGAADEILRVAGDIAATAENLRRAINGGPGAGVVYASSMTIPRSSSGGWALYNAHGTVVSLRAYPGGTAGNALTIASGDASVTASGATLAGGADGNLGNASTDYIEGVLTYVILQPK